MADGKQFGSPKILQFGDKTGVNQPDGGHCAQCEAMLADALDGTLSTEDQALFDGHMEQCETCAGLLADAQRGAAFLEMLRTPAPEPPAELLERILAQPSGIQTSGAGQLAPVPMHSAAFAGAPHGGAALTATGAQGNLIPFPRRAFTAVRRSSLGQILLQPRLAMTAAMAFFSIALTMNLTGVRLEDLRASDLKPTNLKRDFWAANARVAQYYDNLRVVYELESRVHDMQSASENDATAGGQPMPQSAAPAATEEPSSKTPAAPPGQTAAPKPDGSQPDGSQPESKKPAPSPGTSRREEPLQGRRLLVAGSRDDESLKRTTHAVVEGGLA